MGSIKAQVGNLLKNDTEDEGIFEGIALYAGQSATQTFSWQTEPFALSANLLTVNAAIRAAIIEASEAAGNSFNPVTETVMTAGGPSLV